jgi:hypothetical protein
VFANYADSNWNALPDMERICDASLLAGAKLMAEWPEAKGLDRSGPKGTEQSCVLGRGEHWAWVEVFPLPGILGQVLDAWSACLLHHASGHLITVRYNGVILPAWLERLPRDIRIYMSDDRPPVRPPPPQAGSNRTG